MSYDKNDLGYELGYEVEGCSVAEGSESVQFQPETGALVYRMNNDGQLKLGTGYRIQQGTQWLDNPLTPEDERDPSVKEEASKAKTEVSNPFIPPVADPFATPSTAGHQKGLAKTEQVKKPADAAPNGRETTVADYKRSKEDKKVGDDDKPRPTLAQRIRENRAARQAARAERKAAREAEKLAKANGGVPVVKAKTQTEVQAEMVTPQPSAKPAEGVASRAKVGQETKLADVAPRRPGISMDVKTVDSPMYADATSGRGTQVDVVPATTEAPQSAAPAQPESPPAPHIGFGTLGMQAQSGSVVVTNPPVPVAAPSTSMSTPPAPAASAPEAPTGETLNVSGPAASGSTDVAPTPGAKPDAPTASAADASAPKAADQAGGDDALGANPNGASEQTPAEVAPTQPAIPGLAADPKYKVVVAADGTIITPGNITDPDERAAFEKGAGDFAKAYPAAPDRVRQEGALDAGNAAVQKLQAAKELNAAEAKYLIENGIYDKPQELNIYLGARKAAFDKFDQDPFLSKIPPEKRNEYARNFAEKAVSDFREKTVPYSEIPGEIIGDRKAIELFLKAKARYEQENVKQRGVDPDFAKKAYEAGKLEATGYMNKKGRTEEQLNQFIMGLLSQVFQGLIHKVFEMFPPRDWVGMALQGGTTNMQNYAYARNMNMGQQRRA